MKRLFMLAMACAILSGVFAQEKKPICLHQVKFWHGSEDDSRDTRVFTITSDVWRVWWATERLTFRFMSTVKMESLSI